MSKKPRAGREQTRNIRTRGRIRYQFHLVVNAEYVYKFRSFICHRKPDLFQQAFCFYIGTKVKKRDIYNFKNKIFIKFTVNALLSILYFLSNFSKRKFKN